VALDAGTISADAQLDISQLQKATDQAVGQLTRLTSEMGKLPTPKVTVDTSQAQAGLTQAQNGLQGLVRTLQGGLSGKVDLAVGDATQNTEALQKALSGLLGTVGLSTSALGGLTAVLGAGGLAGVAGAAVVGLAALGAELKGFQRQVENTTGASGTRLATLKTDFEAIFRTVPADGGAIASSLSIINQELGLTGPPLQSLVTQINAFTRVMGGDLATNTRAIVDVMLAWQVSAANANQFVADLAKLAQATGQSVGELTSSLTRNALSMQELGLNHKQGALLLDALGDAGIPARLAMTALTEASNKAAKSGVDSSEAWADMAQAIKAAGSDAEAASLGAALFGERVGPRLAKLIREGRVEVDALAADLDDADDKLAGGFGRGESAAAQFQVALNSLKEDLAPTAEAVRQLAAAFGLGLVTAIRDAQKSLTDFMGSEAVRQFLEWQQATAAAAPAGPLGLPGGRATSAAAALVGGGEPAAGGGGFDAGTLSAEGQAAEDLAEGLNKTTQAHHDLSKAQENTAAFTAQATKSLVDQLSAAQGNTALIESLLQAADAAKVLDSAISGLTDRALAAELVAVRNTAEATFLATGSWEAYDAAVALAGEHLAAQKATQDEATRAQREGQKALDDVAAAYEKAGQVAETQYASRLQKLAAAVLPNLDAATATTLQQQLLLNDQMGALATIAAATGLPLAQLQEILSGTGTAFEAGAKAVGAYSQSLADMTSSEQASRIASVFGGLSSGVEASTAALAKQQQQAGDTHGALETLLQAYGVAPTAIQQLTSSLEAGGAAAFAAQEKIRALTTFVRDQAGEVRLKIDVDISNVQQQIGKVNTQIAAASAQSVDRQADSALRHAELERDVAKAEQEHKKQSQAITDQLTTSLGQIQTARSASAAQLGTDLATAASAQNAALAKVGEAERAAATRYRETVQGAQAQLQLSFAQAQKTYNDGVKSLTEQAAEAVEAAAARQAAAIQQAGQAMTQAALAQLAALNQQSTAREDLTKQTLIGAHTAEETSALATERIRQEAQFGFQNAQAALSQQQARDKLAQQQYDVTKDLNKTMGDLAKQMAKVADQQRSSQAQARVDAQNTQTAANKALAISQVGEDAFNAMNDTIQMVVVGPDGVPRLVNQIVPKGGQPPEGLRPGGTAGARQAAETEGQKARNQAQTNFETRTRQLNAQEDAAQARWAEQLIKLDQARQEQLAEFQRRKEALARQAAKDAKAADDQLQELKHQRAKLEDQLRVLQELRDGVKRLQPSQAFAFQKVVTQETGIDFLAVAARTLMTQGAGGL
jgi:trimeric autotransporter adhesin